MKELTDLIPPTVETRREAAAQRQILELGTAIRGARLAREWSQGELARRAKVSQADISRIENGVIMQRGPTAATLCRLAVALDMRIALAAADESVAAAGAATPTPVHELEAVVRRAVHAELVAAGTLKR